MLTKSEQAGKMNASGIMENVNREIKAISTL